MWHKHVALSVTQFARGLPCSSPRVVQESVYEDYYSIIKDNLAVLTQHFTPWSVCCQGCHFHTSSLVQGPG